MFPYENPLLTEHSLRYRIGLACSLEDESATLKSTFLGPFHCLAIHEAVDISWSDRFEGFFCVAFPKPRPEDKGHFCTMQHGEPATFANTERSHAEKSLLRCCKP